MENLQPNDSALEDYLQSLNHLFVDIARLTFEKGYAEIAGGFCELKVATLDSGMPAAKLVAAKTLRLGTQQNMHKRLALRLARELKVWGGLQHPHVLPLLGFYLCDERQTAILISEYMSHGDLKNYITKIKPSFHERLRLVRDLTEGLAYLHTQTPPIRHGDLKPVNVLVNPDRRALLADFGLSKALDTGPTGFTTGNGAKYTLRYSSPEIVLDGIRAESLSNDIWSWGCLVVEALTDEIPFANIENELRVTLTLASPGSFPSDTSKIIPCPQQLQNLLAKCWSRQPNERPSAANCLCVVECLYLIDSTLLGLEACKTCEVTPQPPQEDEVRIGQGSIGEHGGPAVIATENDGMGPVERMILPLIPSNVVAGRIRPRESSIPRQQLDDGPSLTVFPRDPLGATTLEEQPQRQDANASDSAGDAVEGERQRKRIRVDAGPAATNIARRDRGRFYESPGDSGFPQFAFPHNQPQYSQSDMPPLQEYRFPKPPGTEPRQRGSEAGIVPPQLHIAERQYHRAEGTRHGPRGNSDSTLASAMTPTTAIPTPMSSRSSIPSSSKDFFPMHSPYPRHAHRYSRSSGDIRTDSLDAGGTMGGPTTSSPPPIDGGRRLTFERQASSMSVEGRDKDRSLGMPRQELERRSRHAADEGDHERMDVDGNVDPRMAEGDQGRVARASVGRRGRPGTTMEDDERDSVEEFLTTAISPAGDDDRAGRGGEGEERDELQEDREMSPMSTQAVRTQSHSGQHVERWRAVDRERELRQREDEQRADSGPQMQYANSNGLVKIKSDQFRYYSTPDQLKQHSPSSPHLSSSHPQPQHSSNYPSPAFQTRATQRGQLQRPRRITFAGVVTTPNARNDFAYQRASYSGPSYSRRPSGDGPSSSGLSRPSLVGPPSTGGPLAAGTSGTHIIYPHSQQPRRKSTGPAVKPTLNAQGQRTCRQCGQPGRYKNGKCVEKWGPGPAGRGTVCDRCRKRVKRRGTQDAGSLGQQLPLQALPSAQQQQPQLSPRQYHQPQSQSSYPREGPQYNSSGGAPPAREFQFQPPLSASSLIWQRRSKDWSTEPRHGRTGSITTSPTSQQPKFNQPASAKPREKRRAHTYSPSPSPIQEDEARSSSSASQPRSADDDAAASNTGSSRRRKNSGDSMRSEMESVAYLLEVALIRDDDLEVISPGGTQVKNNDEVLADS